jgi:hypothetical protein
MQRRTDPSGDATTARCSRDLSFRAAVPEKAKPRELERALGAGLGKDHHPVFGAFMPWQGIAEPGWDVNFLGVRTRVDYFSMFERLADFSSARLLQTAPPIQNEDYFEWIDLLESVVSAKRRFRMIELGAGWGKWLANGAVAARSVGLDYYVVGLEAEPTHFKWMKQHLRDNGVDSSKAERTRLRSQLMMARPGSMSESPLIGMGRGSRRTCPSTHLRDAAG